MSVIVHKCNNVQNIPRALSLVKNVGDLKLMSGKSTTINNKGTVRCCFQTRSNTEPPVVEVFVSGTEHCTTQPTHIYIITKSSSVARLWKLTKTLSAKRHAKMFSPCITRHFMPKASLWWHAWPFRLMGYVATEASRWSILIIMVY